MDQLHSMSFRKWWNTASWWMRMLLMAGVLLTITVISLFFAVQSLKDETRTVKKQQDQAIRDRNTYFVDERGLECEMLHKFGGYTPVCSLSVPPGDPAGVPTTTTVPTSETGTVPPTTPNSP